MKEDVVRPVVAGQVMNTVTATFDGTDPNPSNDTSSEMTTVVHINAPLIVGVADAPCRSVESWSLIVVVGGIIRPGGS